MAYTLQVKTKNLPRSSVSSNSLSTRFTRSTAESSVMTMAYSSLKPESPLCADCFDVAETPLWDDVSLAVDEQASASCRVRLAGDVACASDEDTTCTLFLLVAHPIGVRGDSARAPDVWIRQLSSLVNDAARMLVSDGRLVVCVPGRSCGNSQRLNVTYPLKLRTGCRRHT